MSFPSFGDRSTAFEFTIADADTGAVVNGGLALAIKGARLMVVSYADKQPTTAAQLETYTRLAVAKLR